MLEPGNNWELFGYDLRQFGKHWLAAWRSLLWVDGSPVRQRLDDVVQLHSEEGIALYQAGQVSAVAPFECEAVLLPDELALTRSLRLPIAVEGDLESVIALEVNANSPFSADDTGYGWLISTRDDSHLQLVLVIVSMSAVMAYLGRQYDIHNARAREVWVGVADAMVVVRGFGESSRENSYRKRLVRSGIILAIAAVLILLIAGVATGTKRAEVLQVETMAAIAKREAAEASRMRDSLSLANETIDAANRIIALYPSPHYEIARLTQLLGDGVYIAQFSMNGKEIRVRGRALDAASVMQKLTDLPDYEEVTAPQAIVKVGNSGLEQFTLNISIREEGGAG
jgi:general secretion pathway protein L